MDADGNIKKQGGQKKKADEINEAPGAVFYNPVQEFNRDISIAVIHEYAKMFNEEKAAKNKEQRDIKVLEALAATGLRSVRYLKEIGKLEKVICNDWDPVAVELIQKNMDYNDVPKDKYESKCDQTHLSKFLFVLL